MIVSPRRLRDSPSVSRVPRAIRAGWADWTADLDDLVNADKSELDAVSAILIGCWSPEEDGTSGSGVIDIDDIRVVYEDYCSEKLAGDIDDDCDVDLADFLAFQACFTGPGETVGPDCRCADFDGDEDVDLLDFFAFQTAFTGPG